MRHILAIIVFCLGSFSFADGGIGGFEGGAIVSKNGPILFQAENMFVNPSLNKTVCIDSDDVYWAMVNISKVNDRGQVVSQRREMISQDKQSTIRVCAIPGVESDMCPKFERRPFVQPSERVLNTYAEVQSKSSAFKFRVPSCNE
jgi:hypothetical protein